MAQSGHSPKGWSRALRQKRNNRRRRASFSVILACLIDSGTSELRCVERLERIDICYGLRLLVPLEIAQRYVLGCKVSYQEAVLFDRCDGLFHVQVLRWLRAYTTEFRGPAAITGTQGARENGDDGVIRKI
jgi:hypothetical protein